MLDVLKRVPSRGVLLFTPKAISETTISGGSPGTHIDPDKAPLTWVRTAVANRLAVTGAQWASVFRRFNSGTYGNLFLSWIITRT